MQRYAWPEEQKPRGRPLLPTGGRAMLCPKDQAGPLSVSRAFVVQLATHTDVPRGPLAGRVEHVVSGQVIWLHDLETMLAFMWTYRQSTPASPDTGCAR